MIHREATIKYKSYDPNDLVPGSHKRICVVCDHCGRVRYVSRRDYRDLCISCALNKRYEDPKEHEKQSKAQIKRYEDPKEHEKQSKGQTKRWDALLEREKQRNRQLKRYKDPEERKKTGELSKQAYIDDPTISQRQSESHKKRYEDGRWNDQLNNFINGEPITDWIDPPSYRNVYNLPEYKKWRISVFERDNYTCQMCGERGCKLNSHHIYKVSNYPELVFKINNGITLCYDCHVGKVNQHEEEYEIEFLSKIFDNKDIDIFGEIKCQD